MRRNLEYLALLGGVCVGVLACDGSARGPVAPDTSPSAVNPAATIAEPRAVGGAKASGHADIQGTPVQNIRDERYSFTAAATGPSPLAKGQVEAHFLQFTGEEFTVHADVTCIAIANNQAWIGSRVRRLRIDGQEQPDRVGQPMIFRVQDTGEGRGATDLASLVFFGFGDDLAYCNTRPAFPLLLESRKGNIQVKP